MKKKTIYFADLVHNSVATGPFPMPLNVGCVAAYARKCFEKDIEIRLFKYPLALIQAIKEKPPDVLGLSNYAWNTNLNYQIISLCKQYSKESITLLGGPNLPLDVERQIEYFQQRPLLDFYVKGQGETHFAQLLERILGSEFALLKNKAIGGCAFLSGTELIVGERISIDSLDEYPSPYLAGLMDEFFEDNLIPIIETDRGCPYKCSFCAWEKRKIVQYNIERVKAELDYIVSHIKKTNLLFFGNANFGINERDRDIAQYLADLNKKRGYPRHVYIEWAKNTSQRVIEMAEMLGEMIEVTLAFQSLEPVVLKNIKRQNIKNSDAMKIQKHFNQKRIPTYSDLILGLPGETKETHLKALRTLFDMGIWHLVVWNCQTLKGSVLDTNEERQKHGIKTKYRLYDIGFGKYDSITAIEHEEVVRSTNTLSEEEILFFRPLHWLIHFMGHYKYTIQLQKYLRESKIHPVDFLMRVITDISAAPRRVVEILESFKKEARDEWFETPQSLVEYFSQEENFNKIAQGEFGKLNQKYAFIVLCTAREAFDSHIAAIAKRMINEYTNSSEQQKKQEIIDDIIMYMRAIYVEFDEKFGYKKEASITLHYNIFAWEQDDYQKPLADYYMPAGITYRSYIPLEQQEALNIYIEQFKHTNRLVALRKMAEHVRRTDLFNKIEIW